MAAAWLALVPVGRPLAASPPDPRGPEAEAGFVERIATERVERGLPELRLAADLTDVARRHAARMAADGRLYHNPNLASEVSGYKVVGENVGNGGSVGAVHEAFMASATHRRQILRPGYREVGVGVVWSADLMWVVEVFREPAGQPAAAESPAAPVVSAPPQRAARPVPSPATAPRSPASPEPVPTTAAPPTTAATWVPAIPVERLSPAPAPEVAAAETAFVPPAPEGVPPAAAAAAALLVTAVALQLLAVSRLGPAALRPR